MRIIRTGVTRTVILTRRWAIKVPTVRGLGYPDQSGARLASFARGLLANKAEREWSQVPGMNPVVWSYRNLVNVYRRAEPVPDHAVIAYDALCPDWVPVGDRKPDNVGIVNGRVVWVDYDHTGAGCPACRSVHGWKGAY